MDTIDRTIHTTRAFLRALAYKCGWNAYTRGEPCKPYYGYAEDNAAYTEGWHDAQRSDATVNERS